MMKIIFVLVMLSISFACIFTPGTVSRLFAEANKHNPFVSSDSFMFSKTYTRILGVAAFFAGCIILWP